MKRYRTMPFRSKIWENCELRQEEQETSSLLAFLTLIFREASEKSSSFNRRMKKRYWANVSEASIQSQDIARSVFRRTRKRKKIKEDGRRRASRTCHIPRARTPYSRQRNAFLKREQRFWESPDFLKREQHLCRRLSLRLYNRPGRKRCCSWGNNSFYEKWR